MKQNTDWMRSLMFYKLFLCFLDPVNILVYDVLIAPVSEAVTTTFNCQYNNDCFHGACNRSTNTCSCVDNWVGEKCNIKVTTESIADTHTAISTKLNEMALNEVSTDILKHREIERGNSQENQFRLFNHLKHKTGTLRQDYFSNTNPKFSNDLKRNVDVSALEVEVRDTCVDDTKRNLKERMCLPGLICSFGTCSQKHRGSHIVFECTCDKGAIGLFCDHKCCLDCGQHGRCLLLSNGTEYCDCDFSFHGDRCELHILDSLTGQVLEEESIPHRRLPLFIIISLSVVSVLLLLAVTSLLLILRERCCLAIMAIPSKCTRYHSRSEGDIIVCYHGENFRHTNIGIQNPEPQHKLDLSTLEPKREITAITEL